MYSITQAKPDGSLDHYHVWRDGEVSEVPENEVKVSTPGQKGKYYSIQSRPK